MGAAAAPAGAAAAAVALDVEARKQQALTRVDTLHEDVGTLNGQVDALTDVITRTADVVGEQADDQYEVERAVEKARSLGKAYEELVQVSDHQISSADFRWDESTDRLSLTSEKREAIRMTHQTAVQNARQYTDTLVEICAAVGP